MKLADGRWILFDYCDQRQADDPDDKRIDLPAELRRELKDAGKSKEIDVAAFSHGDRDHLARCDQFFYFEHAAKYQDKDRVRIKELWVPAYFILDTTLKDEARVLRQEARHRLIKNTGIRVFSSPGQLDQWFKDEGIDPGSRKHLITHAGSLVPSYSYESGGVEIFVHSPFSFQLEGDEKDRNNKSLVLHFRFAVEEQETRLMLPGDAEHHAWRDLVLKTEKKKRLERLRTDVFRTAHHCSAYSLGPEPGKTKTEPIPEVNRLFKTYGQEGMLIIASSKTLDSDPPPPHPQAAEYYKEVASEKHGEFLVTMQYPTKESPKPILIEITKEGASIKKTVAAAAIAGAPAIITRESPRLGRLG